MSSYAELMAQKANLERQAAELKKQIDQAQKVELAGVIRQIKSLMAEHNLTPADLEGRSKSAIARDAHGDAGTRKVAAKYKDPETGSTWTGRGLKPRWLSTALAAGRTLEDFKV